MTFLKYKNENNRFLNAEYEIFVKLLYHITISRNLQLKLQKSANLGYFDLL